MAEKDQDALIRRLKLLSKSQSAFLKVFLLFDLFLLLKFLNLFLDNQKYVHDKISAAILLVNEGVDLITSNNDPRVQSIKKSIVSLRIEDLDTDVSELQYMMREELEILRGHVEGKGITVNSVPNTSTPSSDSSSLLSNSVDTGKLRALEAENTNLRELLKEAQLAQTKALSRSVPPLPPVVSSPAPVTNVYPSGLTDKVGSLQAQVALLGTQLEEKNAALAKTQVTLDKTQGALIAVEARAAASEADAVKSVQSEMTRIKAEVSGLEKEVQRTKKAGDDRLSARTAELTEAAKQQVAEVERKREAEKEEMMDALTQEVEVALFPWLFWCVKTWILGNRKNQE